MPDNMASGVGGHHPQRRSMRCRRETQPGDARDAVRARGGTDEEAAAEAAWQRGSPVSAVRATGR